MRRNCVSKRASETVSLVTGCILLITLLVHCAQAQVGTADVLGTVIDPSGAVVTNAKVTILNTGTSTARTVTTSEQGEYVFNVLPNGSYSLRVEATGFKTYSVTFSLMSGMRARYDVKLETGTVSEKVEVSARQSEALQTDSSTVTSTVEENAVQDLPLNNRNFISAILLQPGITPGVGANPSPASGGSALDRRQSSSVVANGQSDAFNNQLVDGFDNNERISGLIGVRPSIDGIAEMTVDTTNYAAEYSRTAGAVINIITKSGTNTFHGSAYDYFRNDILDAADYFSLNGTKPEYRQNNFGGSFGGPIAKGKTFFFFDIEEDRIVKGIPTSSLVPTDYERNSPGDLTDLGGPNLITCTGLAPLPPPLAGMPRNCAMNTIMLEYFNLYPRPNYYDPTGIAYYKWAPNQTQNGVDWDIRIDHHFSPSNIFFARYANNPVNTYTPGFLPKDPTTGISDPSSGLDQAGPSSTKSQNLQLDFVHIFSPTLLLDLKAGYTRINITSLPDTYGERTAAKLGIQNAYDPAYPSTDTLMGLIPAAGWSSLGTIPDMPIFDVNNTFQYSGSLTYTRGPHNIKSGAGLIRRQFNILQGGGAGDFIFGAAPPYFNAGANMLTGFSLFEQRNNPLMPTRFRSWEPHGYVQDDWRVNFKLSLNLGVRYDVYFPYTEVNGNYTNFVPSTLNSGLGIQNFILGTKDSAAGVQTDFTNVAPRIGFAYSITPKTVLRGGFGMSYFPADSGGAGTGHSPISVVQNYNPPAYFSYFLAGAVVGTGPVAITSIDMNTYYENPTFTTLSAKPLNFRSSYVEQMNLALEREFGGNSITVAYVGVLGHELLRNLNLQVPDPPGANQPAPALPYPQIPYVSNLAYNYNGSASSYHAMQLVYGRHLARGLTLNANYTWSHGMTDTSNSLQGLDASVNSNPHIDYGNSALDLRQRIALTADYELPFGKSLNGAKGLLIKGWQANGIYYWQTGMPFTVGDENSYTQTLPYTLQAGVSQYLPEVIGKMKLSHPTVAEWFNTAAFANPTLGTVGNERVNQIVGPHDRRLDLSAIKNFQIMENFHLQFRAECFNVSNTENFALPSSTNETFQTGNTTFGQITSTAFNENPRQFQFALKLLF